MTKTFRDGIWKEIEEYTMDCIDKHDEMVVISGLVYDFVISRHGPFRQVSMPDAYFRIIYSPKLRIPMVFLVNATDDKRVLDREVINGKPLDYLTSLKEIEFRTEFEFLTGTAKQKGAVLRSTVNNFCTEDMLASSEYDYEEEDKFAVVQLHGDVKTESGRSVEGVKIIVADKTYTAGNGHYAKETGKETNPGTYHKIVNNIIKGELKNYRVTAFLEGYESTSEVIDTSNTLLNTIFMPTIKLRKIKP